MDAQAEMMITILNLIYGVHAKVEDFDRSSMYTYGRATATKQDGTLVKNIGYAS